MQAHVSRLVYANCTPVSEAGTWSRAKAQGCILPRQEGVVSMEWLEACIRARSQEPVTVVASALPPAGAWASSLTPSCLH